MSDKYIMGLYTLCLSARKAVALEGAVYEDMSKFENDMVNLKNVKDVLFQALLLDDVKFEDGRLYADLCSVFILD